MPLCRVFQREDGHLIVVHPAPANRIDGESDDAFHERTMARAMEVQPDLARMAYVDMDAGDLPARDANCDDCGEAHPVRNQWSLQDGRIYIDPSAPNAHAGARHVEQQIDAEFAKENADPVHIMRLHRVHRRLTDVAVKCRHEVRAMCDMKG